MWTQLKTAVTGANEGPPKDSPQKEAPATDSIPVDAPPKHSAPARTVDGATDMRCPDPSAHKTKNTTLQDHASAAALYSANTSRTTTRNPLGPDGKLSSASAATSVRHAQARDLPSFPVVGTDSRTSAGTAAHLANANFKSPEYPKASPTSAAAGKAALLAKDFKMAPLWKPEPHADGNSAATIAMSKKGLGPHAGGGSTEEGRNKALIAATGATSGARRKRSQSTPVPPPIYPDSQNSARNALNAATISHSASMKMKARGTGATDSSRLGSEAMEAARIQHSKVPREMYTDRPPVSLEVEERKRQEALKASAISMAKKMYDVQQYHIDQASGRTPRSHAHSGATAAQNQQPHVSAEESRKQEAIRYINIQEAAQKLAAQRLAKIGPDEATKYRSYYGYDKPSRNRLSISRGRNRAFSNPEAGGSDDEMQSRRIRSQMSQLNKNLAQVDAQKRDQDRKYLLAAAERKVQAQMLDIDKKVFDETGKMSPAMMEEWDAKARARASANSETRMENHGKVYLGHGKYMEQSEVDAIAQARMQPTFDEIKEKTEKRLAEEEEERLELAEKKRQEQIEKERAAEIKAEEKHSKAEEKKALKAKAAEQKAAAKQEKEAEKEKRAEEKRLTKEHKRKSREGGAEVAAVAAPAALGTAGAGNGAEGADTAAMSPTTNDVAAEENDDLYRDPTPAGARPHTAEEEDTTARPSTAREESSPASPTSPTYSTSPKSEAKGIKGLLQKFRRRSKPAAATTESDEGFVGGANLGNSESNAHTGHNSTHGGQTPTHVPSGDRRHSAVSSLSATSDRGRGIERTRTEESKVSESSEYSEARDAFNENLAPPPNFGTEVNGRNSGSPVRDSKFHEVL